MSNQTKQGKSDETAGITSIREGHGANCSSIGSIADTLFVAAGVGSVLLTAIAAALTTEPIRVTGAADAKPPSKPKSEMESKRS